jgi:hypothetical protein
MRNRVSGFSGSALLLLAVSALAAPPSPDSHEMLLCGTAVGIRFVGEVKSSKKTDKYKHCSISCVITNYCGPVDATVVGALKEVYDALGFGDPEAADFEADMKGVKAGMEIGPFGEREKCYRACSRLFP